MSWLKDRMGILRWSRHERFPEPSDEELLGYGHFSHTMHGTVAGYDQHITVGLKVCGACQKAHDGQPKRRYRRRS